MRTARRAGASLAVLAGLVGTWWLVSHAGWVSRVFLPTPEATAASLWQGLVRGDLLRHSGHTLLRMVLGWGLATGAGVLLGVALGVCHGLRGWIAPTLEFLRPLPTAAVMPLAISLWGLSAGMVLAVVAFGALWPVLLATMQALASVHPRLLEVGRALQLPRHQVVLRIGLPHALPDILAAARLAMTLSLILAIVGEMLAAQPGLGQTLLQAARAFQSGELFAGVVLLGLIGFAANALLALVERRWLRWQRP